MDDTQRMANETAVTGGHPDMDYAEHEKTYAFFTTLFKFGTIFCVAAVLVLALVTL